MKHLDKPILAMIAIGVALPLVSIALAASGDSLTQNMEKLDPSISYQRFSNRIFDPKSLFDYAEWVRLKRKTHQRAPAAPTAAATKASASSSLSPCPDVAVAEQHEAGAEVSLTLSQMLQALPSTQRTTLDRQVRHRACPQLLTNATPEAKVYTALCEALVKEMWKTNPEEIPTGLTSPEQR